jgi:hypothetical protein
MLEETIPAYTYFVQMYVPKRTYVRQRADGRAHEA